VRSARLSVLALVLASTCAWSCGGGGSTTHAADPQMTEGEAAASAVVPKIRSSLVGADTLANTRIGGPYGTVLAFRFRSKWTGSVRGVRVYIVTNSDGREGYSGGDGGRLRVSVVRDGAHHLPSKHVLASTSVAPPSRDSWPLVRFANAPKVVAGHYYHVVFTNDDPNPRANYVSINALLSYTQGEPAPRLPDGLAVLLGSTRDGGASPTHWGTRTEGSGQRYAPILDVSGGKPGQHLGLGYMEVWSSNPKPIGGGAKVRQLLGPAPSRAITGAWLRVRREDGAGAPLQLSIATVGGDTLGSATVPAGQIPSDRDRWVHVRFAQPISAKGKSIALVASASSSSYSAFPIRKGMEFGFNAQTVYSPGYAQFTSGGSWTGWDQWGQPNRHDGALQFALDLAGS
jgi:hypothetical protein